jgi:protocatechuate 3,4-dioxygenase beta subunit
MYPNIHRHPDGSTDFDFYRQAASRRRQLVRHIVLKRLVWLSIRVAISSCRTVSHAVMDVWNAPVIRLSDPFR